MTRKSLNIFDEFAPTLYGKKDWQMLAKLSLFICLVKNLTLTHLNTTLIDFLVKSQYLSLYKNPILLIERKKNVFFGFTDLYVDELLNKYFALTNLKTKHP